MAGARWWLSATECSQILEGQIHRKITRSPIEMQADDTPTDERSARTVDQSLNLDRPIGRSKAYVNLRYSGPLMIRSIAENCTACRLPKEHYILFRATHSEKTIGLKSQGTQRIIMSPIIA